MTTRKTTQTTNGNAESTDPEREESLALALQATHDGVWDWNVRSNQVYYSSRLKELLGYKDHELTSHFESFESLFHPEDHDRVMAAIQLHLTQRTPFDVEWRGQIKTGGYRWFSARGQATWDETGRPLRMAGSIRDITERKDMEEALRQSEEMLRTQALVLENMAEGVQMASEDGIIFSTNPAWDAIFGYTRGELLGQHVSVLNDPPEEAAHIAERIIVELKVHGTWHGEVRSRKKDGTPFWTFAHVSTLGEAGEKYWITVQQDITSRKRAEEALSESEQRFRIFAASAPIGIFHTDRHGAVLYSNRKWQQISGLTDEESLDSGWMNALAPEDQEAAAAVWQQALQSDQQYSVEYRIIRPDGEVRWVHAQTVAIRSSTSELTGYVSTVEDITERKQAERTLHENEERFRRLSASSPVGIFQTDVEGACEYTNPQWQQITGLTLEEGLGNGWVDAIVPDDRDTVLANWKDRISGGYNIVQEFRFRRPDGEVRWVIERSTALLSDAGNPLGYVGTTEDITERKRAEAALQLSEAKVRAVVDGIADGVITISEKGIIESVNPAAQRLFGYTAAELQGQNISRLMPSPYQKMHDGYLERYLTTGERKIIGIGRELVGQHKDGTTFSMDLAVSEIHVGERRLFSGIVRDITARKRAERALRQAKEAAEQANRAKSEFLAMMSHEIRTPMNGVIGMTGLLLDTRLTAEQHDFATTVRSSADALLTIINDILDFSKIEAGKLTIEPLTFDLRVAVEEAVDLLAPKAEEQGIELLLRYAPDTPSQVVGDPGRIRQIVTNLAGNAIKFTAQGHVVITITCAAQTPEQAQFQCTIEDTGIGIPTDKLAHLFDRFTQADASTTRKYGGTGLGLAISKQLVELMGGTLSVQSVVGQGSTFGFTLPLPLQPQTTVSLLTAEELPALRVLVVQAQPMMRHVLQEQLASWDLEHQGCSTAAEAVAALRAAHAEDRPYHVALIAAEIADGDGETLGRTIKADPQFADTALVLITSVGLRGDAQRFTEAGFSAYLTKPIHQSLLWDTLVQVWAGQRRGNPTLVTRHSLAEAQAAPAPALHARILLAEDNRINQKVAVRMLEKLGCRVDVATNGQEAVEMFNQLPYDVVLMDCQMPEMDGYEATAEIRRQEQQAANGQHIPIIAMTANAMQGDREHCLAAGMDDYVAKPIKPATVRAALERWLSTPTPQAA